MSYKVDWVVKKEEMIEKVVIGFSHQQKKVNN